MKKTDVKRLLMSKLYRCIFDLETLTAGSLITSHEAAAIWQRALQTLEILDDLRLINANEYVEYSGLIHDAYHGWHEHEAENTRDE